MNFFLILVASFAMTGCSFHACSIKDELLISQASFDESKRLLLLDGDDGTVACRVYGSLMSGTFPRFSEHGILESATRSLLRMKNLTAIRGIPGGSMVGPADYLGNLEEPHLYLYTIREGFPPIFYSRPVSIYEEKKGNLTPFNAQFVTTVAVCWISGKEKEAIYEKKKEYWITSKHLKQSLFIDPGFLEVDRHEIALNYFDPRGVDLSSFKARLVNNQIPFRITEQKLPPKDDYRLVTYLYEPEYANWQIEQGSGLFLEKHRFSQTITPISPAAKGFVVLARTNDQPNELELVGIQIPYGCTLLIEEGCIHGDTTLNGFFMMGMTSDHTTMRTADTVFLKYPETKQNVKMVMKGEEETLFTSPIVPLPFVIYRDASSNDREIFRQMTQGKNFIFNPFSREYF